MIKLFNMCGLRIFAMQRLQMDQSIKYISLHPGGGWSLTSRVPCASICDVAHPPVFKSQRRMNNDLPNQLFPETWDKISASRLSKYDTPKITGVYAYFGWTFDEYYNKEKPKLYYIGSSTFIQHRMATHSIDAKLSFLYCKKRVFFETDNYKELEKALIGMWAPPFNIQHNYRRNG